MGVGNAGVAGLFFNAAGIGIALGMGIERTDGFLGAVLVGRGGTGAEAGAVAPGGNGGAGLPGADGVPARNATLQ